MSAIGHIAQADDGRLRPLGNGAVFAQLGDFIADAARAIHHIQKRLGGKIKRGHHAHADLLLPRFTGGFGAGQVIGEIVGGGGLLCSRFGLNLTGQRQVLEHGEHLCTLFAQQRHGDSRFSSAILVLVERFGQQHELLIGGQFLEFAHIQAHGLQCKASALALFGDAAE